MNILLIDLETAPNLAYVWGKYEQDVIEYKKEWYILCFAYKWLGKKVKAHSLLEFKGNEKKLVKKLWELFNQADIIVAHNGDKFDIKRANSRFVHFGFSPPSPYKTVDTKKLASRFLGENSNKLDDLGRNLGLGRKIQTDKNLWLGCMAGDKRSWRKMVEYNKQDVELLEKLYFRLRPWGNHPNLFKGCPRCGADDWTKDGFSYSNSGVYQKFRCRDCGGQFKNSRALSISPFKNVV